MAQRIMRKKNRATVKGVAVRRVTLKNGNNIIRIGGVTYRNSAKTNSNKSSSSRKRKKIAVKKKKS